MFRCCERWEIPTPHGRTRVRKVNANEVASERNSEDRRLCYTVCDFSASNKPVLNCHCSITLPSNVDAITSPSEFWKVLGVAIHDEAIMCGYRPNEIMATMSCQSDFVTYFRKDLWTKDVVLLLDEFSSLYGAPHEILTHCLGALRDLKHKRETYAVRAVIAAGTYNISKFDVVLDSDSPFRSPFNVADLVQNPNFTLEDIKTFFSACSEDMGLQIDDDIAKDVWYQSNG
jgi:hypothetical protein